VEPEHGGRQHSAAPTLYPFGFGAGIAVVLVGLIVNPTVLAPIGGVIALVFLFLWVRDATKEYQGEPEEIEPETREVREVRPTEVAPAVPAHEGEAAMPEPEPGERFPRSKFLEGTTLGLGAVIGGLVTVPIVGFAVAPAFVNQGHPDIDLGPLSNFPENQWMLTTFFLDPTQGEVARRTAYIRNNGLLEGKPSFTIISNRCAHLGCPVQPNGLVQDNKQKMIKTTTLQRVNLIPMIPAGGFGCPCHGGQYDTEGNRTSGPPVRALDRYSYKIVNGNLILITTFSVNHVDGEGKNAVIHQSRLHGPGEHVEGVEGWFYPLDPPH
jgi:menaquinol-cytochrome c reductase iron-sulfur subunit